MKELVKCWGLAMLLLFPLSGIAADVAALRSGVVKITSTSPEGKRRTGTGFIVKLEAGAAFIVTAYHVVEGDKNPQVEFFTRPDNPVQGEVVRTARQLDVALVVVRSRDNLPQGLQALRLDSKESLALGQEVATIGFPPGLSWAVTKPSVASQEGEYFAVVGGNIGEGSSGGPVCKDSTVVAMVTAADRGSGRVVPAQFLAFVLQGWRIDVSGSVPPAQQVSPAEPPSPAPGSQVATPSAVAPPKPGQTFKDCDDCPEMVVVPPGRFTMGSPQTEAWRQRDEDPSHEITIARAFAVGKYEVTRGEFAQFVREAKYDAGKDWQDLVARSDDDAVVNANHEDAKAYAKWLATKTGKPYRLLSEAEWEYAARAGSTASRFWGDSERGACEFANVAWCGGTPSPAGRFKANDFGLYHTLGNVWEWVEDCYHNSYNRAPADGSPWVSGTCESRVVRGGSWLNDLQHVRSAGRHYIWPGNRFPYLGFRVARTLP